MNKMKMLTKYLQTLQKASFSLSTPNPILGNRSIKTKPKTDTTLIW